MKKTMTLAMLVLAILALTVFGCADPIFQRHNSNEGIAWAADLPTGQAGAAPAVVTPVPVTVQPSGFSITSPMETAAVGFWLPATGTFAMGLAHTVVRVTHSDIPKLRLDLDGTIAQEVSGGSGINEEKVTLGGIGLKLGYNISQTDKTGFVFEPSLGATYLNDFKKFKTITDIIGNKKFAVYGTALLYKW
jgi:hypothetical protein